MLSEELRAYIKAHILYSHEMPHHFLIRAYEPNLTHDFNKLSHVVFIDTAVRRGQCGT